MEFMDVIKNRKKIYHFSDKEVPNQVVLQILEAGHLEHSNQIDNKWYFGIIRDEEIKKKLSEAAGGQDWIASAPVIITYCAVAKDSTVKQKYRNRFGENIGTYYSDYEQNQKSNSFWESNNPLIPGEHIVLSAINHGLDACWVGNIDTLEASKALNLPYDLKCLFLMPIGYASKSENFTQRKAIDNLIFYDSWD